MDFELNDEQLELQRVVRDFAERECSPALVRSVVDGADEGGGLWKTVSEAGWSSLTVPAADGGQGASPVELAITLEELGYVADPTPFLATTSQYVALVRECAAATQRQRLLDVVCNGGAGAAAFLPHSVKAEVDGNGWRLVGVASHVVDGDRADELAIVSTTDDGPAVFVVHADEVTATRTPAFDHTLHVADLQLEVHVPAERVVQGPHVEAGVARAMDEAMTGLAATTVGACRRILDLAVEHVKGRRQFGVPIGSFQAVKHLAVDMYVAIERTRALVHFAALTLAEGDDRHALAASMAKAAAGDCQRIVAQHGVQLFGGLGFTWENDLQIYVRKAKAGELLFGTSPGHRARVARSVLAGSSSAEGTR